MSVTITRPPTTTPKIAKGDLVAIAPGPSDPAGVYRYGIVIYVPTHEDAYSVFIPEISAVTSRTKRYLTLAPVGTTITFTQE